MDASISIYRDFLSLQFVRCSAKIPGTEYAAEGTAYNVATAIARCKSELIERQFLLRHPDRQKIVGIAAHPDHEYADQYAKNETTEHFALEHICQTNTVSGVPLFHGKKVKIWISKYGDRYFVFIVFKYKTTYSAVHASHKNLITSTIKAWTEYRGIQIYQPEEFEIATYTKANKMIGIDGLGKLNYRLDEKDQPLKMASLYKTTVEIDGRFISYYTKKETE
jgi:hypothetical protein